MALSGSRGIVDCSQVRGLLVSALAVEKPQSARRRRRGSHLQRFRLRGHCS